MHPARKPLYRSGAPTASGLLSSRRPKKDTPHACPNTIGTLRPRGRISSGLPDIADHVQHATHSAPCDRLCRGTAGLALPYGPGLPAGPYRYGVLAGKPGLLEGPPAGVSLSL